MNDIKITFYCACLLLIFGCKKKNSAEIVAPQIQNSANLVEPFKANSSSVNFSDSIGRTVNFKGKFDKTVNWKISIVGLKSGANKTFSGTSTDLNTLAIWNGAQDSLYFFRDNEKVVAHLSIDNSEIARDTILIIKRKNENSNQIALFPKYVRLDDCINRGSQFFYIVGYDIEPSPITDMDPSVRVDMKGIIEGVGDSSINLLPNSRYQGGLTNSKFFYLKGQDVSTRIQTESGPDYYIGRLQSVNLKDSTKAGNRLTFGNTPDICGKPSQYGKNVTQLMEHAGSPDNLYFNVFVYGNNDGSKINYIIQEDDNNDGFFEPLFGDESYEKAILVDFKGWKLFSLKYSDFTKATFRDPVDGIDRTNGNGNGRQNIPNIIHVQFELVSHILGGQGQMIIDHPTVSWGGKFTY
ncbi:MAG: hypothetical protein H7329_09080 [Opitutaceae bacterium]|nr:hypothetical protein [Cytophagales bacterium]